MIRNWRWLLKVAVSAGLLFLIFRSVPFSAIWSSLRQADPWDVVVGLVLAVPITIIAAGVGVREGGMILLPRPYGVTAERAVALALLLLGRDLIGICGGGWLELRP